ncbi:arsenate reductase family protein [Robiginitalea sp. SC105]|uniref:arsenate reductase family protein n=1 Tax=Robiginitalea sp. SC105 TaxID=2762332 RepID=UPI00163B1A0F|nr:hypothetical protein [Robiginitalea sp. SC105]MBC2840523.1 hypothetical protein [Robiginitalea sp. SC105]
MSVLATDDNQLTLIYNSETRLGKQALGYLQGADRAIQELDISKTKLANTVWVSLQEKLAKPFNEMLAVDHPDAPDTGSGDLHPDDWLKMLNENPVLLQNPIAIAGNKTLQLSTPSELVQFFRPNSAGLPKL